MRDDFSPATKSMLAARTGHACSNPDCRVVTEGPQADAHKAVNVGVAAHITAASKNFARYDPVLTSEQRESIINGIWLCQTCAKLIDNDEKTYSVALLYHWKLGAEHAAHQYLGKPRSGNSSASINAIPEETIRVVQNKQHSRWSFGTSGDDPIMFVNFHGTITEISNHQIKVAAVELPSGEQAVSVLICNSHDARRPQILRPREVAELAVTMMASVVTGLGTHDTLRTSLILVDQFGNRHEVPHCEFRSVNP